MNMRRLCRFSLVEMLVVIAILAILAGLLLPALGRALDSAQSVQCQNNMKQIGYAFAQYADENSDYLPPVVDYTGGTFTNWWTKSRIWNVVYPNKTWVWDNGVTFFSSVFACPAARAKAASTVSAHYAMNSVYIDGNALAGHKRSLCHSPSRTALFGEGNGQHIVPTSLTRTDLAIFFYHNDLTNLMYHDLHITTMLWGQFPTSTSDLFWKGL